MYEFYSTCPAGLEEGAARLLARMKRAPEDIRKLGAAVTYRQAQLKPPDCAAFQNTYLILSRIRAGERDAQSAGAKFARDARCLEYASRMIEKYRFSSFRVMFSNENRLSAPDPAARNAIERAVRVCPVNRVKPDTEILVLRRDGGEALLLLRLTRRADTHATLDKGALSPHVGACLMGLLGPGPGGVFLDPFAGSGALPLARAAAGPYAKIYAADLEATDALISAVSALRNARVFREDALNMSRWMEKGRVNEIVTDPPWGLYRGFEGDADEFHRTMLARFAYVAAPGARVIVLTAAKESFLSAARANPDFIFKEKFDCLINGKKACAFVLERRAEKEGEQP